MIYTTQRFHFSNFKSTCPGAWALPVRSHFRQDRKEEKFDRVQHLPDHQLRGHVLRQELREPHGDLVSLRPLNEHGDDTKGA